MAKFRFFVAGKNFRGQVARGEFDEELARKIVVLAQFGGWWIL